MKNQIFKQRESKVRFQGDEDNDPGNFSFHQKEVFEEMISNQVSDYCHNSTNNDLNAVLLLDSGSTVDLIQDRRMLVDIRESKRFATSTQMVEYLPQILQDCYQVMEEFGSTQRHCYNRMATIKIL